MTVYYINDKEHASLFFNPRSLGIGKHTSDCPVDVHWRPYVARCDYCSINYTVIAKFETFAKDLEKISAMANLALSGSIHKNKRLKKEGQGRPTTAELTRTYFRKLPKKYIKELYDIYKIDFEMFGYDPEM